MTTLRARRSALACVLAGLLAMGACSARDERATGLSRGGSPGAECAEQAVSPITAGPGAPGPFAVERLELAHPDSSDPVTVFLPREPRPTRRPVIFFSHGYGPNLWSLYQPLLEHMASRGHVVVFGVFPLGRATMQQRYEVLWRSFEVAVARVGDRLDLERVGFVGHSFGGGANPTMAYQGIVDKGWGRRGAFLLELAPWYTYGMTDERFARFPRHVLHAVQVYDRDHMNDHRMAWDLHAQFRTPVNWLWSVRSDTVRGCTLAAEHMMPGRARNPRLLAYGLLRPLDVLAQAAFEGADPGLLRDALKPSPEGYQPLEVLARPPAAPPRSDYRFAWDGRMNPRKPGADAVRAQFDTLSDADDLATDDAPAAGRPGLGERLRDWRERRQ